MDRSKLRWRVTTNEDFGLFACRSFILGITKECGFRPNTLDNSDFTSLFFVLQSEHDSVGIHSNRCEWATWSNLKRASCCTYSWLYWRLDSSLRHTQEQHFTHGCFMVLQRESALHAAIHQEGERLQWLFEVNRHTLILLRVCGSRQQTRCQYI